MIYNLARQILFSLDPEVAHHLTIRMLHSVPGFLLPKPIIAPLAVNCFGLNFPNPIGLAAGLDKNGECIPAWQSMGFGFVEVGTITPLAQPGNPKPRLFRIPEEEAIINRLGFNNKGVDYLIDQVGKVKHHCPIGINIGKNKDTPLEKAGDDYLICFKKVFPYADYITVNISSPNTPGLRNLQQGEMLESILLPLISERMALSDQYQKHVPILVKLSPDMAKEDLLLTVNQLIKMKIDGVIATNTTIQQDKYLKKSSFRQEGGLSGKPLFEISTQTVKWIYEQAGDDLPIVAVGGIFNGEDAKEKIAAGAKLIQVYTGFIYKGPQIIQEMIKTLVD